MPIGLLHPGQMGATVGAAVRERTEVLWVATGRSQETRDRAAQAGLLEVRDISALTEECDVVVSVCPPHAAETVATSVADRGYSGVFVDANAIAPETALRVSEIVQGGGASFVDGSLIGPPAVRAGSTRLYLAGEEAARVAVLFAGSPLEAICLAGPPPAASALKMCYAGFTKGSAALLIAVRALSRSLGVEAALLQEWEISQPALTGRSGSSARGTAPKAWRFEAEMAEIAATFDAANLPDGFHQAAGELYRRLATFKGAESAELDEVLSAVLQGENSA